MSSPPNYLRTYRKRSGLNQEDIAFLMGIPDYSNISRYEKGQRAPTTELLLTYKHLFDTPIESFFEQESEMIRIKLIEKIKELLVEIKKQQITLKNTLKIKFLEEVITKLTL
ncbi:MAG TPA: helix-turn-helix transcriptional regulator [Saprospiraceae bacterium]|nr:helix-turn-helix transcriptional regulator [Saprospiraceae bacterium]